MSFWDKIARVYDIAEAFNGKAYRAMTEGVRQVVPAGARVLDCAAGTGELTIAAAEKAESVLCTDTSLPMLEMARKKCARAGIKNVSFAERDIMHLNDEDGTYNVVIAGNVLHLLDDPEAAVKELCRVTKTGGKLILPTFLMKDGKMPNLVKIYKMIGFDPAHYYTADEYKKMLESCSCGKVKLTVIKGMIPIGFGVVAGGEPPQTVSPPKLNTT